MLKRLQLVPLWMLNRRGVAFRPRCTPESYLEGLFRTRGFKCSYSGLQMGSAYVKRRETNGGRMQAHAFWSRVAVYICARQASAVCIFTLTVRCHNVCGCGCVGTKKVKEKIMHLSHRTTFNSQVSHVALVRDNRVSPGAKTQQMSGDTAAFRVCHDVYLVFSWHTHCNKNGSFVAIFQGFCIIECKLITTDNNLC